MAAGRRTSNPGGWLTTTAGNRALDRIRREKQRDAKHQAAFMYCDDTPHEPTGPVEDYRLRPLFTCVWGSNTSVRVGDLGRYHTITAASTAGSAIVLASFLYKSIARLAQIVILRCRADIDKEVEILVLRHQLAVLRRQVGKVRTEPADQAVLALLSPLLSRARWPAFFVTPATLLR